jgi:prephenate dehydrogenase
MAQHLRPHFPLLAYDPAVPPSVETSTDDVTMTDLVTAASCAVVIIASPVDRFVDVISSVAPHLRPGALVLDVGSVKILPAEIMRSRLPAHASIVATHPLFGPQSAGNGIRGLKIAVCPVRGAMTPRVVGFLRRRLRLDVIVTTPEAHDRDMATAQGLTHLIAKVITQMEPLPTRMTTRSFDLLMQAVGMVRHDSAALFQAIEQANPYARDVRTRFFDLASELDAALREVADRPRASAA